MGLIAMVVILLLGTVAGVVWIVYPRVTDVPAPSAKKENPRAENVLRAGIFESAHRVATQLKVGQEVGMNREKLAILLQELATEVALLKEKVESPREQAIAQKYSELLSIYKDSARMWDVRISVPGLKRFAQQWYDLNGAAESSTAKLLELQKFEIASIHGIPLNLYPEGSTGIDYLVDRYRIPVTEEDGWRTVPIDSVQMIWAKAAEKSAEVDTLRNP